MKRRTLRRPWQPASLSSAELKRNIRALWELRIVRSTAIVAAALVGLYVIVVGLSAFVIYRTPEPNRFVRTVERFFSYPAASVDGQLVPLSRYRLDTAALTYYAQVHEFQTTPGETEQFVMGQLIDRTLYKQALDEADIAVNEQSVRDRLAEIYTQIGEGNGEAKFAEYLRQNYGPNVTLDVFKTWLREAAVEATLQQELLERVRIRHILVAAAEGISEADIEAARQKAVEIRNSITDASQFAEIARNHSDDVASRDKGGEFGTTNRGDEMPVLSEAFENAIFSLTVGEISEPVLSPYGWHIVLVEEKTGTIPLSKKAFTEKMRAEKGVRIFIPLPSGI